MIMDAVTELRFVLNCAQICSLFDFLLALKVSKGASGIDTIKYHTWPRIPMGKWQTHSQTPQTRAKRSALSQQVTTKHTQTDTHKDTANTRQNKNIKDPQKKYRLETVSKIYWRTLITQH